MVWCEGERVDAHHSQPRRLQTSLELFIPCIDRFSLQNIVRNTKLSGIITFWHLMDGIDTFKSIDKNCTFYNAN